MRSSRVAGFTLVELLVVIAIIGVLISLLLPALNIAREAARKASCQNNLKQLSLAVINYEQNFRVFPPSGVVDWPAARGAPSTRKNGYIEYEPYDPQTKSMYSWIVLVLPFFEQQALHKQFNFNVSVLQQDGREPQSTFISALACASDNPQGRIYSDTLKTRRKEFAKGNYAAFCSPYHVEYQNWYPGALIANVPQTRQRFKDGFSTTLMLSEVRTRGHNNDQRGAWALPWTASTLLAVDVHDKHRALPTDGTKSTGFEADPDPYYMEVVQTPNTEGPGFDTLYSCPDLTGATFEGMPCRTYTSLIGYLSAAPRSRHPGGVYASWCDGRVTFLNNTIDKIEMGYLVSIDDNHVVKSMTE